MSYRCAAPVNTVADCSVKNSDSVFNREQSLSVLKEDNKKKLYNKDNKISNFFAKEAKLISV
jgi:hypothetical protein